MCIFMHSKNKSSFSTFQYSLYRAIRKISVWQNIDEYHYSGTKNICHTLHVTLNISRKRIMHITWSNLNFGGVLIPNSFLFIVFVSRLRWVLLHRLFVQRLHRPLLFTCRHFDFNPLFFTMKFLQNVPLVYINRRI